MEILKDKNDCCGCHACFNACPVQAIEMKRDEEGFLYPVILQDKCIHCNKCKSVCPILHKPENLPLQISYGCYAKDTIEHQSSSSGGIFAVLARNVLLENGIVSGASYDENQMVHHIVIESLEQLQLLKETKYVQSRIEDSYKKIKEYLIHGKKVIFSGTPCQVAGLKSYLGQDYNNLFCIDLICHGVPSPKVWKQYLQEKAEGRKIEKVTFRNKCQGISKVTLDYHLQGGEVIQENYADSLYMKGFLQNLYVRPSCFQCQFKGIQRCSDMTIGDFWSVKEYHPEFYHEKGVSAIIIHSEKGKALMDKIKSEVELVEATAKEIACWNENLLVSAKENPNRKQFFESWKEHNIMHIIEENLIVQEKPQKPTFFSRVINRVKSWRI